MRHAPAGSAAAPHRASSAEDPEAAHVLPGGPLAQLGVSVQAVVQTPQMQSPGQSAALVHARSQCVSLPTPSIDVPTLPPQAVESAAHSRAVKACCFIGSFLP